MCSRAWYSWLGQITKLLFSLFLGLQSTWWIWAPLGRDSLVIRALFRLSEMASFIPLYINGAQFASKLFRYRRLSLHQQELAPIPHSQLCPDVTHMELYCIVSHVEVDCHDLVAAPTRSEVGEDPRFLFRKGRS